MAARGEEVRALSSDFPRAPPPENCNDGGDCPSDANFKLSAHRIACCRANAWSTMLIIHVQPAADANIATRHGKAKGAAVPFEPVQLQVIGDQPISNLASVALA